MSDDRRRHIFLDVGTTNARAYLVEAGRVVARASASVGVRDTARDGTNDRLKSTIKDLIASLVARDLSRSPSIVVGAGMISSSLGLAEVPHVGAPASIGDVASAIRRFDFSDVTPLPVLLVPGVRTGEFPDGPAGSLDLMRGEETLCFGLLATNHIRPPATVLNLGSHWKAIRVDAQNRIAASVTTLSGEMIHAIQSDTILAGAVQQGKPDEIEPVWVDQGIAEYRVSGLARAMFCVRLLEQTRRGTPVQRMSYLLGAFIGSDLDAFARMQLVSGASSVSLVGPAPLTRAWRHALNSAGISSDIPADPESAFVAGLESLLSASGH